MAFCLLALGASPAAHAAKRVAFVVGIDAYDNLPLSRGFGPFEYDVVSVAFSPDGKRIYALVSGGYFMRLDPASGEVGAKLGLGSQRACCQMVVSPDGKHLASGNYDDLVLLWDAETGYLVRSFKAHSDDVASPSPFRRTARGARGSFPEATRRQSGFGTPIPESSCEVSILALIRSTPSPFL